MTLATLWKRRQDAALHGLQAVAQIRDRAIEHDVGGVLEEVLLHQGLELSHASDSWA
jgi:hypothetical protein